ncbi:MAG TPA: response regulator transcription factor [Kofleriaceae bacterium]|jgi:DNA-binding NarL/FixJ family response regulator|nr:response regulator transcription factor [Kofleriaceae bacterium]
MDHAPAQRTVAIVDDDADLRSAVELILKPAGWCVQAFETAHDAVAAARAGTLPRMVLMDMSLPGESASEAIADIVRLRRDVQVVVLTSFQREDFVFEALRVGAVGYVLKQQALDQLAEVLAIVDAGGSPLSPSVARRVLASLRETQAVTEPLSDRERDILLRFADGKSYGETADELAISIDTVRTHVRRMYGKLQVKSRPQAVLAALRRGLLG